MRKLPLWSMPFVIFFELFWAALFIRLSGNQWLGPPGFIFGMFLVNWWLTRGHGHDRA